MHTFTSGETNVIKIDYNYIKYLQIDVLGSFELYNNKHYEHQKIVYNDPR